MLRNYDFFVNTIRRRAREINFIKKALEPSKKAPRKFKSDADRIVHRHLENKDDKITEEDLKSVRVGVAPDETVATGTEAKTRFGIEDDQAEGKSNETKASSHKPRTPWDIIE